MRIGDFFPDDLRRERSEEQLKIGAVLRFHNEETTPEPKIKIIVIVGFDAGEICVAYVFVNTKKAPNPALQALQHLLSGDRYSDFLEYDSYVDCSKIRYQKYAKSALLAILQNDVSVYCGSLMEEDLQQVLAKIQQAATIPPAVKQRFGLLAT